MGVVFDEVVTSVEAPPQPTESRQETPEQPESPQMEAYRWQQHQATFWRRRQRLEAE